MRSPRRVSAFQQPARRRSVHLHRTALCGAQDVSEGLVERRLEPQRLGDAGLQIVADDRLRYPTEEGECPALALDPVRQFLAEAGMGEGEGRRAQHRNEDLSLADDASIGIDDWHGVTRIVGLHHRACLVAVAEGCARPALESAEPVTKPRVAITIGVRRAVFLP